MKSLVIYILLIFFLFNTGGYYFLYLAGSGHARSEMTARIRNEKGSLRIIRIIDPGESREFHRIGRHEILYRGVMYDIVTESETTAGTVFTCVSDSRETRLLAGLKGTHGLKTIVAEIAQFLVSIDNSHAPDLSPALSGYFSYPGISVDLNSTIIAALSPPPERFGYSL